MLDRRINEDRRAFPRPTRQTRRTLDWIAKAERIVPEVVASGPQGVDYMSPSEAPKGILS